MGLNQREGSRMDNKSECMSIFKGLLRSRTVSIRNVVAGRAISGGGTDLFARLRTWSYHEKAEVKTPSLPCGEKK